MDGNTKWVNMHAWDPPYKGAESHGLYTSSILSDGKLIVDSDRLFALDAATGKLVWQNPTGGAGPASLRALALGKEPLVVTPMSIHRSRDGKPLYLDDKKYYFGCFGTPVMADGRIFRLFGRNDSYPGTTVLDSIRLPASPAEPFKAELTKGIALDANRYPRWFGGWYTASPLYHEGLLYCLSEDGVLFVVDADKQEVVYQKLLDLDLKMDHTGNPCRGGACASPALAGKYIYIFGNHGACIVLEPGRTFRQVARNRVENATAAMHPFYGYGSYPEITASCPVFEGKRLYYRALDNLYCIEENGR